MPVRPEELIRTPDEPILEDRKCAGCGYNLRGLRTSGNCPECGKPIRERRELPRYADQMVHAPLSWLRQYAFATLVLGVGGWVMALSLLAWSWTLRPACGGVALLGALAWSLGTFLTTRPRPRTKATVIDPQKEWGVLRTWARVSQPFWILGIGLGVAGQIDAFAWPVMWAVAGACVIIGVVGWWPLMMIQSNLAYWASDTDLATKMRNASWCVGGGLFLGTGTLFVVGQGWCGGLIGTVLFIAAWTGPIIVSLGYVLLALWQLWRMAHWVTLNHITGEMKDDRLRERARRAVPPNPQSATSKV